MKYIPLHTELENNKTIDNKRTNILINIDKYFHNHRNHFMGTDEEIPLWDLNC